MPKSLMDTFLAAVLQIGLVDGVADDEHVVDADTD